MISDVSHDLCFISILYMQPYFEQYILFPDKRSGKPESGPDRQTLVESEAVTQTVG